MYYIYILQIHTLFMQYGYCNIIIMNKKGAFIMSIGKSNHEDMYKQLGLNIAFYRKIKNLTQLQLAEKVGISRTHISNIEAPNITTSVSLNLLLNIADCLDIDVCKLLERRVTNE